MNYEIKYFLRFQNLKLYLQNHKEIKIDNTLKDWYLKFKEKERSKKKIISEIDNFVNEIYKLQVTTFLILFAIILLMNIVLK